MPANGVGILYRESVKPCYLEKRTYLHGTTILCLFIDALDSVLGLDGVRTCFMERFRILVENDRQGEVVVVKGGCCLPERDANRGQARMSILVDDVPFEVWYLMADMPMDCREPYSEADMVGAYTIDTENAMRVEMKGWDRFESWIRAVVATNKVFCEHLFGHKPYRWVHLSGLDLVPVLRPIPARSCPFVYKPVTFKGGIGGKDYAVNRGHLSTESGECEFDICFCY